MSQSQEIEVIKTEHVTHHEETAVSFVQQDHFVEAIYNYRQTMCFYEAGIHTLTAKLQILRDEFQCQNDRNPIESISSRIKSPESIMRKMQKKKLPMNSEMLFEGIHDIAGVRVICPFVSDVYYVADMLAQQRDIEFVEQKDYIARPKENGYRSLHLIVNVDVFFSSGIRKIPVEIQIRTIAMDCWASLEHQLRYKKEHEFSENMNRELKAIADQMADSDLRMQKVASQIPSFFSIY